MTPEHARAHLNSLAKPPGSLGRLEDLAVRLCVVQQTLCPRATPRRCVLFAADHGVVTEGVSAWSSEVTRLMVSAIVSGGAASSVLAATTGTELRLIDVGVVGPGLPDGPVHRNRKVRAGSRNLALEPSLTVQEFHEAVAVGELEAVEAWRSGIVVVAAGEMGIGNTTAASCLTALLTKSPAEATVGPGAGASEEALARKRQIVADVVARGRPRLADDPETVIASMCGLEIAAIAGFHHRASALGLTVVLDGFVATAAALVADHLWPGVARSMIAAHQSAEPGHAVALAHLGLEPALDTWQMRLGEGTGALLVMPLLDAAAAIVARMATFDQVGIDTDGS
ncbi:nicotinate-nucleotide/dimethylbenzimidazole phosphoribosyltransferase [Isosphaera pallida ATCC 43644]|uniref:Nicotinate-nucleotide--dimethylbenzimidazole phosphoribosyltransferase n=1 Tax=Isosphaera pallida (strain ATCC 43644 / DSM 9630 / IS1B) TaxID=575540 RepID=E8QWS9_ISOPI|nr:nicotinate-nucleotide--dimethylbenzimidazole phosphoribosyltransferase [Isosphaera pallida]ADV62979.1 nicotinate-nucleotide/dimethylbenzimidazole phosphoribosyltransferase [Isosphaera pallida ATCC 43644]